MPSCYMDREAQGSRAIKAIASSGLYSSRTLRLPVHIANSGIYSVYYEKCRVLTSNYNTTSSRNTLFIVNSERTLSLPRRS